MIKSVRNSRRNLASREKILQYWFLRCCPDKQKILIRSATRLLFIAILLIVPDSFAGERPLIGITSYFRQGSVRTSATYVRAVEMAGGAPVCLPAVSTGESIQKYTETLDGLLLVGGLDIPPDAYGEEAHETVVVMTPERFAFESEMIRTWLKKTDKPILGICLGMQFTNVMSGGSLIQDIPSQVDGNVIHRSDSGATHIVHIGPDSRLHQILGVDSMVVNSYHHQAVKDLADGFNIVARSKDGVPEAMEINNRFGQFLQWHPEAMDSTHHQKIFRAFIDAVVKDKRNKQSE